VFSPKLSSINGFLMLPCFYSDGNAGKKLILKYFTILVLICTEATILFSDVSGLDQAFLKGTPLRFFDMMGQAIIFRD
jgi:hypothetical protein